MERKKIHQFVIRDGEYWDGFRAEMNSIKDIPNDAIVRMKRVKINVNNIPANRIRYDNATKFTVSWVTGDEE